jgi:hypothetical protein
MLERRESWASKGLPKVIAGGKMIHWGACLEGRTHLSGPCMRGTLRQVVAEAALQERS